MDCRPPGSSVHGDPPGKNTGVGCHLAPKYWPGGLEKGSRDGVDMSRKTEKMGDPRKP